MLGWLDHEEDSPRSFVRRIGKGFRSAPGTWRTGRDVEIAPLIPGRWNLLLVASGATHAAVLIDIEIRDGETHRVVPMLLPMRNFRWPDPPEGRIDSESSWVVTEREHRVPVLEHGHRRHGRGDWLIYGLAVSLPVGKDSSIIVPGEEATLHWRTKDGKPHSVQLERVPE